jgi:hypothetical protein
MAKSLLKLARGFFRSAITRSGTEKAEGGDRSNDLLTA